MLKSVQLHSWHPVWGTAAAASFRVGSGHRLASNRARQPRLPLRTVPEASFVYSEEVWDALVDRRPIVALESTIVCHGMPFPKNVSTAMEVEQIVRENGATPATIAILDGHVHIGLSSEELEMLGRDGPSIPKCSRRDLPFVLATGSHGATTVAGTMFLARQAGIEVFVTGGIGGVHRGAERTMDISADLTELGRTPVMVICSGVKSILDIPKTLEFLETQGVPVLTVGSKEFPAFFTPNSGSKSPFSVNSCPDVARWWRASTCAARMDNGMVVAVPIPSEHAAMGSEIENAIQESIREANSNGVTGARWTPFILSSVAKKTEGRSLAANIHLVKNNAVHGAQIASSMHRFDAEEHELECSRKLMADKSTFSPVVVGGSGVDFTARSGGPLYSIASEVGSSKKVIQDCSDSILGTSVPGMLRLSYGGVARNVVEALGRLDMNPKFVSVLGNDALGQQLHGALSSAKVDVSPTITSGESRTATYTSIVDNAGELVSAVADMAILDGITFKHIEPKLNELLPKASIVAIDGNFPADVVVHTARACRDHNVSVFFEPTSVPKAMRCVKAGLISNRHSLISYIKPNVAELFGIMEVLTGAPYPGVADVDFFHVQQAATSLVKDFKVPNVIVSMGAAGTLVCRATDPEITLTETETENENGTDDITTDSVALPSAVAPGAVQCFHLPPPEINPSEVKTTTGAGDTLVGATIAGLLSGLTLEDSVRLWGTPAAGATLRAWETVSPLLSQGFIFTKS